MRTVRRGMAHALVIIMLFSCMMAGVYSLGVSSQIEANATVSGVNVWWWYDTANKTLHLSSDITDGRVVGVTYQQSTDSSHGWASLDEENLTDAQQYAEKVVFDNTIAPTTTESWFYYFEKVNEIQLVKSNVAMLDTSNVTNMSSMFQQCSFLSTLDVSRLDTSNVSDMSFVFAWCPNLNPLDVSDWNTSNVETMRYLFCGCDSQSSLDVSDWNTSKVTDLVCTFAGCNGLTSLDLSDWNTSKVTSMWSMFMECEGLTSLDVSGWSTLGDPSLKEMFSGCKNLKKIYASASADWSGCSYSQDMFNECTQLVGGNGTAYSTSHVDANYAKVDGLNGNPGYFTATEDLDAVKDAAKRELDGVNLSNYSGNELNVVKKAINDGKSAIDVATSIDAVNTAKTAAMNTISAQKTNAQKEAEAAEQARQAAIAAAEAARQGAPGDLPKAKSSKPKASKKAITVKWKKLSKKQLKKGVSKMEVWVSPDGSFASGSTIEKTVSKKKASLKVKGLAKGTYYVKVRAITYSGGTKVVGPWSAVKTVKVKK